MEIKIGKVLEVFIPGNNIESKQIGFKVLIDNEEVIIIQEQDYNNVNILKNDLVEIKKQIIDNKEYFDVELYEGEDYE